MAQMQSERKRVARQGKGRYSVPPRMASKPRGGRVGRGGGQRRQEKDTTNLYVKGLWKQCTQVELDDLFRMYGVITQSRVFGDGVAFVRFETALEASMAIRHLHGTWPQGKKSTRPLHVELAHKRDSSKNKHKKLLKIDDLEVEVVLKANENNVYVRGLPLQINENKLKEICRQFGEVARVRVCRGKGVAFVRFRRSEDAMRAIRQLTGKYIYGSTQPLLAKLANSDPFASKVSFRPVSQCPSSPSPSSVTTASRSPSTPHFASPSPSSFSASTVHALAMPPLAQVPVMPPYLPAYFFTYPFLPIPIPVPPPQQTHIPHVHAHSNLAAVPSNLS